MALTANLQGSLTLSTGIAGDSPLVKGFNLSYTGSVFGQSESLSIGTSPTTLSLPVSPGQVIYIKNLSTTATVTVSWTPTGGASAVILTLEPTSTIIFIEGATGAGVTAISLTASAASTPVETLIMG